MEKIIKVAFLDDGIDPGFIPVGISYEHYIADIHGVKASKPEDGISHGTVCYQIFCDNVTARYSLVSIKVLDNTTGTGNHKALVAALKWCAAQDIDIINMSMGSRQYTDFAAVADAVRQLSRPIIVAACSNANELTFPACLPTVIGVRHCNLPTLAGTFIYTHDPYDQIEIQAYAADMPVSLRDGYTVPLGGSNSHAAPLITARVCNYLAQGIAPAAIRDKLKSESAPDTGVIGYDFYKNLFKKWERPEIPVVAICTGPDDKAMHNLRALIAEFVKDGYRTVCLSACLETSSADFIYSLHQQKMGQVSTPELIGLYYNFTLPDILFLHMSMPEIASLPDNLHADLILTGPDAKELGVCEGEIPILSLEACVEALFSRICEYLS